MAKVRVWNDNKYTYQEQFRDLKIEIPAGKYILMEDDQAVLFKGSFSPIKRDANDQPDPRSYKMIRIEKDTSEQETQKEETKHVCAACKYIASSAKDLEEHTDANHLDQLVDQELADNRRKGKRAS